MSINESGVSGYSDFMFVGKRNYIHGTQIFDNFIEFCRKKNKNYFEPKYIVHFSIKKEITARNGFWTTWGQIKKCENKDLVAIIKYIDIAGNKKEALFIANGGAIQPNRSPQLPSMLSQIELSGGFQGRVRLIPSISSYSDFFQGLIAANKALHVETLRRKNIAHKNIRFLYVEHLPVFTMKQKKPEPIEMVFEHKKNIKGKDRTYTLSEVMVMLGTKVFTAVICYSY